MYGYAEIRERSKEGTRERKGDAGGRVGQGGVLGQLAPLRTLHLAVLGLGNGAVTLWWTVVASLAFLS
jgi:hypothetical protein